MHSYGRICALPWTVDAVGAAHFAAGVLEEAAVVDLLEETAPAVEDLST